MSLVTLFAIALGVSADAFAVALGKGLHLKKLVGRDAFSLAIAFGVFQALMPVIGYLLARSFRGYITEWDHWIAFGLLSVIGGKMLWEALTAGADDEEDAEGIRMRELLVLSLATSIDALAVGISFAFLDVSIVPAAILIGVVTAAISLLGVYIGHRAGLKFRKPAEIAGGLILIAIGVRVLLDHLGVI